MRRAARVDQTAAALVKHARALGCLWLPLGSVVDGLLLHRGRVHVIDWKAPKGRLTAKQRLLLDHGWPIRFISTIQQLEDLLT